MASALRSYGLLLHWELLRLRGFLAVFALIQVALAVGIVYGLAFLLPRIDPATAAFLATGAPTMTLLVTGLAVVPGEVAQAKLTGRFDYVSSLPVPPLAVLGADVTYWLVPQIAGMVLALFAASARFGFALDASPLAVPALLLVAVTSAAVGYSIGAAVRPQLTQQLTSFITLGLLLFSPVNFPIERLPAALQTVHRLLPVTYMADLVRWSLTGRELARPGVAFAVVAAWCGVALAVSYRAATRRR